MTIVLKEGHLTDKCDERVGPLNTILIQGGGGNLNDPIFEKFKCPGLGRERGDVEVSS